MFLLLIGGLVLMFGVSMVCNSFTKSVYKHQYRKAKIEHKQRIRMEKLNRKFPKQ